ncbi:MAG: hypothetical protein CSA62_12040 [Planctomycetota bacterium]|nr:MAG: hypothetical protein CSA62_12040 [Planctomycetota bacterium]
MKTALVVQNFPPEFLGGTEQVVAALAKALKKQGAEPCIICGSEDYAEGGALHSESYEDLEVHRLLRDPKEQYGLDLTHAITAPRFTDLLLDLGVEVLHLHHWWTLGHDLVRRARALGLVTGITLHDLWTSCPRFFRRPIHGVRCPQNHDHQACVDCLLPQIPQLSHEGVWERLQYRDQQLMSEFRAAGFIAAPSEATRNAILRHTDWEGELAVVPHGLLYPVQEPVRPRGPDDPIRVGSFGNLVPEKGYDQVLEAVAGFGEELELRFSGHAPDPAYVERLMNRAKEIGVHLLWTGPYGPEDPHPARELDLAVFPSLCQESYGLVVDEALAHGVPVVVSSRGALPERAARGGVILRSGGIGPLRVALSRLLRSRRELASLREDIPQSFPSIDDAAEQYFKLYELAGRDS